MQIENPNMMIRPSLMTYHTCSKSNFRTFSLTRSANDEVPLMMVTMRDPSDFSFVSLGLVNLGGQYLDKEDYKTSQDDPILH